MAVKVAIVHDYIICKGGMERTVLVLAKAFKGDIWTTKYLPDRTYPEYKRMPVFAHDVPFSRPPFLQTSALLRFRRFDLSDYDLIITSGNWAKHVGVKKENHPQIHYENTPVRAFYDLYDFYKNQLSFFPRQLFKIWVRWMRRLDQEAVRKIDVIVCNSKNVQKRIKTFYGRDAEIVGVPVDVKKFRYREAEDYFLSVQRLEMHKRVELQIEAFRHCPHLKLKIVGASSDEKYWKKLISVAPKNVEFLGSVSDEELIDLYSRCKAVIQTAIDEDFGEIPVEAMASGKPCIAVNEGGFRETIIHGKTGILINPPYVDNLIKALRDFDKYNFDPMVCIRQASKFSVESFVNRFEREVRKLTGGQSSAYQKFKSRP
jgi:glycosyltransferase involved in cell wall biosynthesis